MPEFDRIASGNNMEMPARSPLVPDVAFVCASRRFDGIFFASRQMIQALRSQGVTASWYQCVDPSFEGGYFTQEQVIRGFRVPIRSIEEGFNRLWAFPRRVRKVPERILVATDPTLANLPLGGRKGVVIVHDLRPLTPYGDRVDTRAMFLYALRRLKRFDRILTFTDYLKLQLEETGFDPERIGVVPLPSRFPTLPTSRVRELVARRHRGDRLNVTYVTTDRSYKNLDLFIRLAREFGRPGSPDRANFTLVSRLRPATRRAVAAAGLENLRVTEAVEDMATVYLETDVLLHPSLHEGFGAPLVEAMAFGIPVVTSRLRPMSDLVGDAGLLANPLIDDEWAHCLRELTDPHQFEMFSQRSMDRSRLFSLARFQDRVAAEFGPLLGRAPR